MIPHIREWLSVVRPDVLIEPFAGGGIVSLTAIMEGLADRVVMAEVDHDVAAFWHAALDHTNELIERVHSFQPTRENIQVLERAAPQTVAEHGFRTLVLNRTRRGGILAAGAALTKNGENGAGVSSRWYPETLVARLRAIGVYASRIAFTEGDGMQLIEETLKSEQRASVFADPPYTVGGKRAGARLYNHNDIDHAELFRKLAGHKADFLMTYDCAPEVQELTAQWQFSAVQVEMKNGHNNHMTELIITPKPMFT